MLDLKKFEVWFVTGSQHLYGEATLQKVAEHSQEIVRGLAQAAAIAVAVTAEHLADFAEMADVEFLLIDKDTRIAEFKKELRWNEMYYALAKGL